MAISDFDYFCILSTQSAPRNVRTLSARRIRNAQNHKAQCEINAQTGKSKSKLQSQIAIGEIEMHNKIRVADWVVGQRQSGRGCRIFNMGMRMRPCQIIR